MGLTARVGSTPTSGTNTLISCSTMEIYTAIAATVGAVTGMLAAAASLWNSHQFSVLNGRVDELSAHSTAAYARQR